MERRGVDDRVPDTSLDLVQVELSNHGYQSALSGIGVSVMSVLVADTAALLFLITYPKPKFITHSRHGKEVTRLKFFSSLIWTYLYFPNLYFRRSWHT
jgi:hypothetical protein